MFLSIRLAISVSLPDSELLFRPLSVRKPGLMMRSVNLSRSMMTVATGDINESSVDLTKGVVNARARNKRTIYAVLYLSIHSCKSSDLGLYALKLELLYRCSSSVNHDRASRHSSHSAHTSERGRSAESCSRSCRGTLAAQTVDLA